MWANTSALTKARSHAREVRAGPHTHTEPQRDGYRSLGRRMRKHTYRAACIQEFYMDVQIDMEAHRHTPEHRGTQMYTEACMSGDLHK